MHRNLNHRVTAAAIASVALLAGATGAGADTPSATVDVQAGPLATTVDSESIRQEAGQRVDSTQRQLQQLLAEAGDRLDQAQQQLRATQQRLSIELYRTRQRANGEVDQTSRRARSEIRVLRQRVIRLQARVRRLRGRVSSLTASLQRQAIQRASSAIGGAWVLADRAGNVLNQSGGVQVIHNGTGNYSVKFDTSRSGCANLSSSGPTAATSGIRVSPSGAGSFEVRVSQAGRPRNGGFYLAVSC
jgi:hypothetical protein